MSSTLADPIFVDGYKRDFTFASENVNTGEYHLFTKDNITFGDELAQAALASGSIPGVFQPRPFKGNLYMDGGTTWNVNIVSAVQGCMTKVDSYDKIIVDVMICGIHEMS